MKIIIDHNGMKREIKGSFAICSKVEVLEHIAKMIQRSIIEATGHRWVIIPDFFKASERSSEPIQWSEDSSEDE